MYRHSFILVDGERQKAIDQIFFIFRLRRYVFQDAAGRVKKKALKARQHRQLVSLLLAEYRVSQRRAMDHGPLLVEVAFNKS
jgi:hypothetical protein